jgi:hypothetical protein
VALAGVSGSGSRIRQAFEAKYGAALFGIKERQMEAAETIACECARAVDAARVEIFRESKKPGRYGPGL